MKYFIVLGLLLNSASSKPVINAEVMRAIAAANEAASMVKVEEVEQVGKKITHLENVSRVNEAINKKVKQEEQEVIEAANKRMAEVHANKETEATSSADKIDSIHAKRAESLEKIAKEEQATIDSTVAQHSDQVVSASIAQTGKKVKANDKKFNKRKQAKKHKKGSHAQADPEGEYDDSKINWVE